jgi:hypothetical protein
LLCISFIFISEREDVHLENTTSHNAKPTPLSHHPPNPLSTPTKPPTSQKTNNTTTPSDPENPTQHMDEGELNMSRDYGPVYNNDAEPNYYVSTDAIESEFDITSALVVQPMETDDSSLNFDDATSHPQNDDLHPLLSLSSPNMVTMANM